VISELERLKGVQNINEIARLRKVFKSDFTDYAIEVRNIGYSIQEALSGKLTHAQYCQKRNIQKNNDLNQEEFISQLCFQSVACEIVSLYVEDVIRIVESKILVLKFPNEFTPTAVFHSRVLVTVYKMIEKKPLITQQMQQAHLEMDQLDDDRKSKLLTFKAKVELSMQGLQKQLMEWVGQDRAISLEWLIVDYQLRKRVNTNLSLTILLQFKDILKETESFVKQFNVLRKEHIKAIKELFSDLSYQQFKEKKLLEFCQGICFESSLLVLPAFLLSADIDALIKNNDDPTLINGDWHLAPIEIVDYTNLLGIEEAFQDLPQQLLPTIKGNEKEKNFEKFKIEKGMKVRKFLKALYERGFLPQSIQGDHLKLVNEKGASVVVPLKDQLKRGTAHSVEAQVAKAAIL
jgi:predicted RNA binding protein YcfA (HicA-like mRNA interferase family)